MPSPVCVLVVEDEALVRLDMADYLTDEGYEVLEAATADEAMVILETNPRISVVVTDVDMPGKMDGLMLASAVSKRWPPTRIIVVSGHRRIETTDLPTGTVFFSKPYRQEAIATSVRDLLN